MGVYSSIYVEFKSRKDSQWHLLQAFVPEFFGRRSFDESDRWPDENNIASFGNERLWRMFRLVRQGCVRDLLSGDDAPFNDRGFPDDLSPELKERFDGVQKRIDEKKEDYLFGNGDWRWGKSWCLLSEFNAYLDEKMEKCKSAILSEHSKQLSDEISEKLDIILEHLVGGKEKKSMKIRAGKEDYIDRGEMLEYYLNEELDEVLFLLEFAAGIGVLYEFLTDEWVDDERIRLVFYSS